MSPKKEIFIINDMPLDDMDYILNLYYKNKFNKYLKILGTGSFSTVYEYKNYAIKYFEDDDCIDCEILERLQGSNYFPKLYFYISEELMIMEKVDGVLLSEYDGKLNFYSKNIFEIMEFCYHKSIFIDDLHSDNIMVDSNGNLKIIDVGLYKFLDNEKETNFSEYLINNANQIEELFCSTIFNKS